MSITVRPINEEFKVELTHQEEKVSFYIKQLDYKTKSHITGLITKVNQGQVTIDSTLAVFFNLKYGLKRVEGLQDENEEEYKLRFETGGKELTDECVDELLATPLSTNLQYCAMGLSNDYFPGKVLHPMTGQPLEGVEVIPAHELKSTKKKS